MAERETDQNDMTLSELFSLTAGLLSEANDLACPTTARLLDHMLDRWPDSKDPREAEA